MTSTTLPAGVTRGSVCEPEDADTGGGSVSMAGILAGRARTRQEPRPAECVTLHGACGVRRQDLGDRTAATGHLSAGEVSFALLQVGREALLGVLPLEQELLQLALDRERGLERDLGAGLHRALDAPHGLGRLVRGAELLGVRLHLVHEL